MHHNVLYVECSPHIEVGLPSTRSKFLIQENSVRIIRQQNECLCGKQEVWVESRRNQLGNEISSTHICHYTKWLKSSIIRVTKQSVAHSKQASLIGEAAETRQALFVIIFLRYQISVSPLFGFKIDGLNRNPIAREIDLNFGYLKK